MKIIVGILLVILIVVGLVAFDIYIRKDVDDYYKPKKNK